MLGTADGAQARRRGVAGAALPTLGCGGGGLGELGGSGLALIGVRLGLGGGQGAVDGDPRRSYHGWARGEHRRGRRGGRAGAGAAPSKGRQRRLWGSGAQLLARVGARALAPPGPHARVGPGQVAGPRW